MRVTLIIPALDEEESLPFVLDEIPHGLVEEVIVVDNGSSDGTSRIARQHGARVLVENEKGYGAACLKGIATLSPDCDVVAIMDGDRSDYPEDLAHVLAPIAEKRADLVIGSRVLGTSEKGALYWNQRLGNALACTLIRLLYGFRFTDMGPMRAIRRESLEKLSMQDRNYGWNAEMQVKALIEGLRIVEVPVRYRKRMGRSKISGTLKGTFLAGAKIVWRIVELYPSYRGRKREG